MIRDYLFNPYILYVKHVVESLQVPGGNYPERFTLFHELDIITQGVGPAVINGQTYHLQAGDVFYRVPNMYTHHFFPYSCYYFVFDPFFDARLPCSIPYDVINGTQPASQPLWNPIPPFSFARGPFLGRLKDPETIVDRARCIYSEYISASPDWLFIRGQFMLLLHEICQQLGRDEQRSIKKDKTSPHFQRMMYVQEAIRKNVEHNWSLSEAADMAHLSPNFFSKVFHEICDETFVEYVQRMKIKRAMLLLLDTDMTLGEIAYQLGFCDVTYFQTVFKKQSGITPNKFRKMIIHI